MNDPRHPEAKTMAAFVDGSLEPKEVAAVADHLRECADCRTVVSETARFEREEIGGQRRIGVRWQWAAAAAVATILVGVPIVRWNASRHASPLSRLIKAAPADYRKVEGRLSGFSWARLQPPARAAVLPGPAELKFAGAVGEVIEDIGDRSTPGADHAKGIAYVLIDRYREGIGALEQAANGSRDARVWSDLAAARYAMAEDHPSQLPLALADADRAISLDRSLPEAHFNRALILEGIGIRDQARAGWQRYLELDPSSEWSIEARGHLHRLAGNDARFDPDALRRAAASRDTLDPFVRRFPQEARSWGEGPMLAGWAEAATANDTVLAAAQLDVVRAIGASLAAVNGEHLLEDAVIAIDRAGGGTRDALVRAQLAYRDARLLYRDRNIGNAERRFREAVALFAEGSSPMATVASYYAASAVFDQNRGPDAHDELTRLLARTDRHRHRALVAQIHWQLSVIATSAGDWGAASREAGSAAAMFQLLGERANASIVNAIAAIAFELLGDMDLSWRQRVQTFNALRATDQRQRRSAILHSAALTLAAIDKVPAAVSLIDLMIEEESYGDSAQLVVGLATKARFLVRAGDSEAARRTVGRARMTPIRDAALHELMSAQIDLAEAALNRAKEPQAAIASLDRCAAFFAKKSLRSLLAETFLERARAYRAAKNDEKALADYASALQEIELQRATVADSQLRFNFLDVAAQTIEEAVDLRMTRGDAEGAFAVAGNAHALLDPGSPQMVSGAIPRMRPRVALLEYSVLPRATAIFCVTSDGLTAERVVVDREVLAARAISLAENIRRRAPLAIVNSEAAALFRLLIAPVQTRLGGVDEIVIVPDRQLHAIPFAALRDEVRQRYLVEDYVIRFAPSSESSASSGNDALEPAVVIADPLAPGARRLRAGRDEAQRIASLHGATLLAGADATRERFAELARESSLIHYTGHANSSTSDSWGALLLTPTASDSGIVGSSDVTRLSLPRHPLVVLAACGTFRGDPLHVAGMSSLSRAFLLAGARGVIGTLWEIDDDVAAAFFLRLHEHLHAGASPAGALRATQIDLLHSADARLNQPAVWAPVELLASL